jgi:hypothetical protein
MKMWPLMCFCTLACLGSGCSFFDYCAYNMIETPFKELNHCQELRHFNALARQAWLHVCATETDHRYSDDYAVGFIEGYVDYLDAGGNGEPPAAPPDRYQLARYHMTPEGVQAIDDWFAGFRHGAAEARASGQRELVVVPLSLPPRSSSSTVKLGGPATDEDGPGPQEPMRNRRVIPRL